jgi:hypothetical protein
MERFHYGHSIPALGNTILTVVYTNMMTKVEELINKIAACA